MTGDYKYRNEARTALTKKISQIKKRLIAKHGPEFAEMWKSRVRNVQ